MLGNLTLCPDATPSFLRFFDLSVAPPLLFYSYIPIAIISLCLGLLVLVKDKYSTRSKLFLGVTVSFSIWIILILVQWTGAYANIVHFAWQALAVFELSIFLLTIYFFNISINKKDISRLEKLLILLVVTGLAAFMPTEFNIRSFNLTDCESNVGILWTVIYALEILSIIVIILTGLIKIFKTKEPVFRRQIIYLMVGVSLFLGIFSITNIWGELTKLYEINLFGPIGTLIFLGIFTYLVVRYHIFNFKLLAAQAFVWILVVLIGSQFFFIKVPINFVLNGIGFVSAIVLGQLLFRAVKKEIKQKEELAKLNLDLEKVIQQRESLMHLITHKVKGAFTHSKYIFAGLLDGMFGEINPEVKKMAELGLQSDTVGVKTIDMILNASNLQKGIVQYEKKDLDFKDLVTETVNDRKIAAEKKGLELCLEVRGGEYTIFGDAFWLKEVTNNLVDNAINYTQKGKVEVRLENQEDKILLSVKDTGVGITVEDKAKLFTEGGRGKESVKFNVDSTGYGLYSVKLVSEGHGGKVWAESPGKDKGSTFFVLLPKGK